MVKQLLKLASDIVVDSAKKIEISSDKKVSADLKRDVKIEADKKLHRMISDKLEKIGAYPVFSEEGENAFERRNSYWVLDPVDGSVNFSHGIPLNCISLALWKANEPILGIIYDFNRDELFSGIIGDGAWLNGTSIHVSGTNKKESSILCTGFPVGTDFSEVSLLKFVKGIQEYQKVRLFGSAALSLAYVACGRAEAYKEDHIAFWDVAAGIAIVLAAGGNVEFTASGKKDRLNVTATNGKL